MKLKLAYKDTISQLTRFYDKNEAVSITRRLFEGLELDHLKLVSDPGFIIPGKKYRHLQLLLSELLNEVPIQYVLGYTWFYDRKFLVSPKCLIPRPETEEMIYNLIGEKVPFNRIIDIGTGSGCIAVSIKCEFPGTDVWAMDIFPETLQLARKNAKLNQAEIHFVEDDILLPGYEYYPDSFDLMVSNPPYVRESEKVSMHANIIENEPPEALFVEDSDPLVFYRAIFDFCLKKLKPGGYLYAEINEALSAETAALFENEHFRGVSIIKDFHNKDRFIKAIRNER